MASKVKKRTIIKICKGCGKSFPTTRANQKFCCDSCRARYYEQHYFVKQDAVKTCPGCGTTFRTSKPKTQIYCCVECREKTKHEREEAVVSSVRAEHDTYLAERFQALEDAGHRCTSCGKSVKDGAILDVVAEEGKLRVICFDCKRGKEFKGGR